MRRILIAVVVAMVAAVGQAQTYHMVWSDGTNLTSFTGSSTTTLASAVGNVRTDANNTFAGGTTQAVDQLIASNITMRGSVSLGTHALNGTGGTGLTIDSTGQVFVNYSGTFGPTARSRLGQIWVLYFSTNGTAASPSWNIFRTSGTVDVPTASAAGQQSSFNFRGFDGTNYSIAASMTCEFDTLWTAASRAGYLSFQTTKDGVSSPSRTLEIMGDKSLRLYNMTTAPTLASGYGVLCASNDNVYAGSSTTLTKISPHNDANELEEYAISPYDGFLTRLNHENQAKATQLLCAIMAKDHPELAPYATNILQKIPIPVEDWREREKKCESEDLAQWQQWKTADTEYKQRLAQYQLADPKAKATMEKPTAPDMSEPVIRKPRPIPVWAVDAQKQFDSKHIEAPK